MKITSELHGHDRHEVSISGTEEEIDDIRAMVRGCCWIRATEEGGLERRDRFVPLPPPELDPLLPPLWAVPLTDFEPQPKFEDVRYLPDPPQSSSGFGIHISHLCGYHWTPERANAAAVRLQGLGFECMRSRRGRSGQFWEKWVLPYLMAAQGDLKDFVDLLKDKPVQEQVDAVVGWCCRHLSFGCLDVTIQRAAMTTD